MRRQKNAKVYKSKNPLHVILEADEQRLIPIRRFALPSPGGRRDERAGDCRESGISIEYKSAPASAATPTGAAEPGTVSKSRIDEPKHIPDNLSLTKFRFKPCGAAPANL